MAEAAMRLRESRARAPSMGGLRDSATLVSILANNAPDIDSFYESLVPKPLGSLLHHRWHTHTFVLVPLRATLALLVTLGVARARNSSVAPGDRLWLFA